MQERYDIIGDVHGCYDAQQRLCRALGYDATFHHPDGRTLVFVGDLINRGPESLRVLRTVSRLVHGGRVRMGLGNHDDRLRRWLCGAAVSLEDGGLGATVTAIETRRDRKAFKIAIGALLEQAPLYLIVDGGRLNGDAIGKSPEGKTLRRDWAADYRGDAFIVYGHTPQERAEILGRTVNVDTGAYRGGLLTAFRWPEQTLVYVPSRFRYMK